LYFAVRGEPPVGFEPSAWANPSRGLSSIARVIRSADRSVSVRWGGKRDDGAVEVLSRGRPVRWGRKGRGFGTGPLGVNERYVRFVERYAGKGGEWRYVRSEKALIYLRAGRVDGIAMPVLGRWA
jgi:hypothetical protein